MQRIRRSKDPQVLESLERLKDDRAGYIARVLTTPFVQRVGRGEVSDRAMSGFFLEVGLSVVLPFGGFMSKLARSTRLQAEQGSPVHKLIHDFAVYQEETEAEHGCLWKLAAAAPRWNVGEDDFSSHKLSPAAEDLRKALDEVAQHSESPALPLLVFNFLIERLAYEVVTVVGPHLRALITPEEGQWLVYHEQDQEHSKLAERLLGLAMDLEHRGHHQRELVGLREELARYAGLFDKMLVGAYQAHF